MLRISDFMLTDNSLCNKNLSSIVCLLSCFVCRLSSVFCQPSNEIQSTKYYVRTYQRIMQNKPNFQDAQMNVSIFSKKDYNNETAFRRGKNKPNQTQFKPNTKPIPEMPKMSLNTYLIRFYSNKTAFRRIQNKPKQTQFQTQFFNSFIRVPYTLRGPTQSQQQVLCAFGEL